MSKKFLVITALLIVMVLAIGIFAGCESYKNTKFDMDDTSAVAQSNGGSVVYHGDYIYFINGYSGILSESKENWFGNVLKGAIVRIKKSDVADMSKAEVIVPKACISKASTGAGFSIYGDYIYYTTTSDDETKNGTVNTDDLVFMRTRLDGQKTKVILTIEDGLSTTYKYTPNGLVYLKESKLYFKSTEGSINSKKEGKEIADKVSNVSFPASTSYDPSKGYDIADYFFYTKASEESGNYTNVLHVANTDGFDKVIIDENTYTDKPHTDSRNAFNVTILDIKDEGNSLTLLYKKSYYVGTSSSSTLDGIYMYKFTSTDFAFDRSKEVKLTSSDVSAATIISYDQGVLATSSTLTWYAVGKTPAVFADEDASNKISSASVIGVNGGYVYYYTGDKLIYRYKLDGTANVEYLGSNKINADFITPELVVDGDKAYVYYFNSDKGDYLYRADLTSYDRKEGTMDDILFGVMTDDDSAKYADKD